MNRCRDILISLIPLSIVIPAYNEERRLPSTLDRILTYLQESWGHGQDAEVVVVDDGSRDQTATIVEQYSARHDPIRLIRNPGNRGKGYAVRSGMLNAKGEWVLFSDADLSTPIEELDKLLAEAKARQADVVIGSRAVSPQLIETHQPAWREYSGRAFNLFMRITTGLPFLDTQCGFKLYRTAAARRIFPRQRLDGFSFDVEDLMIAKYMGFNVIELGVRWSNVEGSKVSTIHGLRSFADVIRIRWNAARGRYDRDCYPEQEHAQRS